MKVSKPIIIWYSSNHNKQELMSNTNLEQFAALFIKAWSTSNSRDRKKTIEKIYSNSADFYANEPGDEAVSYHGWDQITNNITQVNKRLVFENGLKTELSGYSENHGTLRITWQMKTPNDEVALNGMNFLILDSSGKIDKDFIFIK